MSEAKRMLRQQNFMKGKFHRLVVSISAGGLGLNLQRASIAVFAEKPYSHAEFEQCSDRVHRIGSVKRVRIYNLTAVDSMDENLQEMINDKQNSAEIAGVAT